MKYEPKRDLEQKVSICRYKNSLATFHFHKTIELIYVIKGRLKVCAGTQTAEISSDEAAFMPAYYAHSVEPLEESVSYTFMVPDIYYSVFTGAKKKLDYFFLGDKELNRMILTYLKDFEKRSDGCDKIIAQGYVNLILGNICAGYEASESRFGYDGLAVEIIKYIEENFQYELSLDILAGHFKYSKPHFSKLFNTCFRCNLNYFINFVRYNYVQENINTGRKLADLIYEAGFKELSSYYRFCKKKKTTLIDND